MQNSKVKHVYLILLLVLCLISFGMGYFVFKAHNSQEIKHIPVNNSTTLNVMPITPVDATIVYSYVGYVEAINQLEITPYISGFLQKISVTPGSFVKEGDLLLNIEDSEYKAKLDAAEASVMQAMATYEYNKKFYERVQKSGKNVFAETDIDNAKKLFLESEAQLNEAKANRDLALTNFKYTVIKSQISGIIGNFNLSPGAYVSPNDKSLLNIVQTDPIRVVFSLTDVEYLSIKKDSNQLFTDNRIKLKLANGDIFEHEGDFKYTDNKINKDTNTLAIYAYFKNDKNKLLPNSFVTVETHKTFKNTVLINKNLIKLKTDGNYVLIARNNILENIKVNILADKNNMYILENTFKIGDLLVLDEVTNLKNNKNIRFNIQK